MVSGLEGTKMDKPQKVVVIGAGIVGVSAAIWLRRGGLEVVLVDRALPGTGTSHGNAGILAASSVAPVTTPGLGLKGPRMLLDPKFPLFLRWSYLPRLAPWLREYLGHANDRDTRRIAAGLTAVVSDTIEQHKALSLGTKAAEWLVESDYSFAYADRAAFDADAYVWALRREAGFEPQLREGSAVQDYDPSLGRSIGFLATLKDHGFIRSPGRYVEALAEVFRDLGGQWRQASVTDFETAGGRITAVLTADGPIPCDRAVLATGVWSKPLMRKLGLNVPLESERGYHIIFKGATGGPNSPMMVAAGKFVATPMDDGLRCAGMVEFGGLDAGPSKAPLTLLRRNVKAAFPGLHSTGEIEWLGHRPAPSDSLPLIGDTGVRGVYAAFGHHHIGLTAGPKTGRLVADLVMGRRPDVDMSVYDPKRFPVA